MMTSLLRQLVAGPRARHAESKLDLCYVTDEIIVTSGPAVAYPSLAYRNPLPKLLSFLVSNHNEDWCIFEFRAEGTGYSDKDVHGQVRHFPWPDHHPPPFAVMPKLIESMRTWLDGDSEVPISNLKESEAEKTHREKKRVAILHCKAGKGRSGTVAISFLISTRGWTVEDALKRFTERRMRPGWGEGISIKSQRRWIDYVDRWARGGEKYQDGKLRIVELQIWGRREGVTVSIRGFAKEGKKIKVMHKWKDSEGETTDVSPEELQNTIETDHLDAQRSSSAVPSISTRMNSNPSNNDSAVPTDTIVASTSGEPQALVPSDTGGSAVPATLTILRPTGPLIVDMLDANIQVERRNRTSYGLPSVVTSTAHSWFNAHFEGKGPERDGQPEKTGKYTVEWDAMDGLKGSSRRGVRAIEKVCVVWEIIDKEEEHLVHGEVKHHAGPKNYSESSTDSEAGTKSPIVEGDLRANDNIDEAVQSYIELDAKNKPSTSA